MTDLYLERLDGDRVLDGTDWVPLTTRSEVIRVAGGEPVTITVRSTRHGPLLSDRSSDLLAMGARPAVDPSGSPLPSASPAPTPSLDPARRPAWRGPRHRTAWPCAGRRWTPAAPRTP